MKPMPPTALLLVCLLFCFPVSAETAKLKCPSGQFWRSPNGGCVPCRSCGVRPVLQPCSPTHDTVCGSILNGSSMLMTCESYWGVHVDFKGTSFLNLTKQQKAKQTERTCGILQEHQEDIFGGFLHEIDLCGIGEYQWYKPISSGRPGGPVVCRPCSQCLHGRRVMFPCKGNQDTLCSFDRVNNTAELFSTNCSTRKTIHVYSSRKPTLSQRGIQVLQGKLKTPLCRSVLAEKPSFSGLWQNTTAVSAAQSKAERVPRSRAAREASSYVHKPSSKRRTKRKRRKNQRKATKALRRCRQNSRSQRKWHKKCARIRRKYLSLCRRRKYKGKLCKEVQKMFGRRHENTVFKADNSERRGKTGSVASIPETPTAHNSTLFLDVSLATQERPTARHFTVSSPRAAATTWNSSVQRFSLVLTTSLSYGDLDLAEDEPDDAYEDREKDAESGRVGVIVVSVLAGLTVCVVVFLSVYCRRRMKYSQCKPPAAPRQTWRDLEPLEEIPCPPFPARKASLNTYQMLRIVDPLRRGNRPHSRDSGYSTIHSAQSSRGSSSLCKEVPSIEAVGFSPMGSRCAVQQPLRGSCVTADSFGDSALSAAGGSLPALGPSGLEEGGSHPLKMIADGRRSQSLSEDDRLSDRKFRPKIWMFSGERSVLQPFDSDTEVELGRDGEITESRESVFNSVCSRPCSLTNFLEEGKVSTVNISLDSLCRAEGRQSSVSLSSRAVADVLPACYVPTECGPEVTPPTQHLNNSHPSTHTERSPSLDDLFTYSPTVSAPSPKLRSPSGDSWRSSGSSSSSSSVSMQLRIPLQDMDAHWLHKASVVGPENLLTAYTASAMTQTEDWSKSNLTARPLFCSTWQGRHTFTAAGGIWSLPRSDVRLEVTPGAVPAGSYVDVTGATYTNLPHLRQVLKLRDQQVMAGPLAELDAGADYRFLRDIFVFLPHCLPPGVAEDQVTLHHIHRGEGGQLIFRTLPSKSQHESRRAGVGNGGERRDCNGDPAGEEDLGYFELQSNGELKVVTKRFCCFICSICSTLIRDPRIHLVVTAGQQVLESAPSGVQQQIRVRLYLWDRKITITDFRRDYLGHSQVGEQTLHVIDDCQNSLVKLAFAIKQEETQKQWRLAVRSPTTEPILSAVQWLWLRELMCCHAQDAPSHRDWLVERVPGMQEPCHDFQCFIDVDNVAHPKHPDWKEDDALRQLLTQRVTIFVGDISTAHTLHASVEEDVLPQTDSDGKGGQKARPQCQCHCQPDQRCPSAVSNTPFGHMEQEPFQRLGLSNGPLNRPAGPPNLSGEPVDLSGEPEDVFNGMMNVLNGSPALSHPPGPEQLSEKVRLHLIQSRIRISDPTPLSQPWSAGQGADEETEAKVLGRSISYPLTGPRHTGSDHRAAEAAAKGQPCSGEAEHSQHVGMARQRETDQQEFASLPASDRSGAEASQEGEDTTGQHVQSLRHQTSAATANPWEGKGGARPKVLNTGALHQNTHDSKTQGRQVLQLPERSADSSIRLNPKQETQSRCAPSILVHDHTLQPRLQTAADCPQTSIDATNGLQTTADCLQTATDCPQTATDSPQTATDCPQTPINATNGLQTSTDCPQTPIDATNGLQTATDCPQTSTDATNGLQTATDRLQTTTNCMATGTHGQQTSTDCLQSAADSGHVADERGQSQWSPTGKTPAAVEDRASGVDVRAAVEDRASGVDGSCSDHSHAFVSAAYKPNLNRRSETVLADGAQNIDCFPSI